MNKQELREINQERLGKWIEDLAGFHATPALLVGIGHDHVSGNLYIVTVEDIDKHQLEAFLAAALQELMSRR